MAAGAYKGLTIRIGADTTKLTSSLRGANSAIFKTQAELNKLNKALKLDPGNSNASQLQMGALASQATNVAREMEVLKKGMGEIATMPVATNGASSVAELAEQTASATLAAEDAKDAYNKVDAELAEMYRDFTKLSSEHGNGLKFGNADGMVNDLKEIDSELEVIAQNGNKSTAWLDGMKQKAHDLKGDWDTASAALDDYANVAKLEEMNVKFALAEAKLKSIAQQFAGLAMKSDIAKSLQPLQDKLETVSAATDRARERFNRLDQAFKLNPTSIGTAADRTRSLQEATDAANAKARMLREQINAYRAAGIDEIAKKTGNSAMAFEKAKEKVASLEVELEKNRKKYGENSEEAKKLERALADALKAAKTAGAVDEYRNLQVQLRETRAESKQMRAALTSDLQGVGAAAVQAAIEVGNLMKQAGSKIIDSSDEIDAAYRDMRKTVSGTEEQYEALYDAAMKYSQTHVTSADTMLEMEALAGQVGVTADQLQNFSEVAANLDVATDMDAEEIALKMGQIVNVMSDLKPENVQAFADALVDLGNKMPAQESAIMQISQRLSSIGDVAGFSTPEILAWSAAIASTGQRSEAAATGVSNIITTMQSAVSNGGAELEKFASATGKTSEEFKKAWGDDASGVLRDFIGKLQEMGPDAIQQLEDLGIEGIRSTQTLLSLAKTVENVDKAMNISEGAWDRYMNGEPINGMGEAAQEAARKAEGFSGSLAKMKNSAQVLAATLGETLAPYIDTVAGLMQHLTDVINNMDDATKDSIVRFGALTAGIATVYPVVSALGGAFLSLGKNVVSLVTGGIGFLASGAAFASIASGFETIQIGALLAGDALGGLLAAITPLGVVAAAVGALATLVGGYYIKKFLDAKKRTDDFNATIDGIRGTTDNLHRELLYGKEDIEKYGKAWIVAKDDVDEFIKSQQEHVSAMNDTRDESTTTIGMLQQYKDIIDECAGAGEVSAEKQGKLEWALRGLEEATGKAYSAEDILAGKMEDEEGNAIDLKKAIDDLIEAKKKESQLNALTEMRTEAVKGQMEAGDARDEAYARYQQQMKYAQENYGDIIKQYGGWDKFIQSDYSGAEYLRNLESEWKNAQQVYDEWEGKISDIDMEMGLLSDTVDHEREGIMRTDPVIKQALDSVGITGDKVRDLAVKVMEAGVSAEDFANITSENFALMAQQSGGDIDTLVGLIQNYNETEFESKYGNLTIDGYGNVVDAMGTIYEWNGTEFVPKYTEANVEVTGTEEAKTSVDEVAAAEDKVEDKDVDVTANVNGTKDVENLHKNEKKVVSKTVSITANVYGLQALSLMQGAISSIKSKTVDVVTNSIKKVFTVPGNSATGAYIPYNKIPKHAAGIFTRPTLTNIGWVGEDGAELYSGNSLIPLTNRKYSMPYINDISDAVAKKIGSGGTSYNLYINGASINDDPAIRAAFLNLMSELQRKGAMNVGNR